MVEDMVATVVIEDREDLNESFEYVDPDETEVYEGADDSMMGNCDG